MTGTDVVCNGQWLKGLAGALPVDVSYQTQWGQNGISGGGCWTASWSMPNLDKNFTYDCLATGSDVRIYVDAALVFSGKLDALDRDSMQATAKGYVQYAPDFLALQDDGSGNLIASSTPNSAIDRAIAASPGWNVRRLAPFCGSTAGTTPYVNRVTNLDTGATTATTQTFNTIDALLSAVASATGNRWAVDAERVVYAAPDKTTADWILIPGAAVPGVTDPDFVTDIYGRFCYGYVQPAKTGGAITGNGYLLYATTHVSDANSIALMGEVREAAVDLTPLGPLANPTMYTFAPAATNSPATTVAPNAVSAAVANLQGRLDLAKARIGWTAPLNPQWFQLLTPGGSPAPLHLVKAGDLVSIHGTLTPSNQLDFGGHRDVIVSATDYTAGASTIQLDPLNMTSRDLGSILAAAVAPASGTAIDDVDPGNPQWFTG